MALLLFWGLLALSLNFLCSVLEAVLLSVTPSYIAAFESGATPRERSTGRLLREQKENVDRPLAAVLAVGNFAQIGGAAGVGAQAQAMWGNTGITVASAVLTLLMMIISELIPKTLAAVYWRGLAPVTARVLRLMVWMTLPLVVLSQAVTRLLSRDKDANEVSREELSAMADLGAQEGVLGKEESRRLHNLLHLRALTSDDIMTPRTVALILPECLTVREALERVGKGRFSRIPVFRRDVDDITGYFLKTDLLLAAAHDRFDVKLSDLRRDIMQVPEKLPLPEVLERMLEHHEHLALVVDDFGGTSGLVTMEDVVETLLGTEILDETDLVQDLRKHARERWKRRASKHGLLQKREEPAPAPVLEEQGTLH
ncbi:MAG TPA: CNNM domain-containing protein [Myxococcus sp.]|nr:CNNM domain-containing protein [Myxococcus sp.]